MDEKVLLMSLKRSRGGGTSLGSFGVGAGLGQHQGDSEFLVWLIKEAGTFATHGFIKVRPCVLQEVADLPSDHLGVSAQPFSVAGGEHVESEDIVPTSRTLTYSPRA